MSISRGAERGIVLLASPAAALRRRWGKGLGGRFLIHEVADRAGLEDGLARLRPSVVFLDLALPELGGLGSVPAVHRLNPSAKIVLLAGAPNGRQAVFALVAGAQGYCSRSIGPSLIRKATEVVQGGEIWVGRQVVRHLLKHLTSLTKGRQGDAAAPSPTRFAFLAPRESEIALLVGVGANNKEIAARLSITEATVKAHLTSIFRKLRVSDRLRLALFVTQHRAGPPRAARRDLALAMSRALRAPGPVRAEGLRRRRTLRKLSL